MATREVADAIEARIGPGRVRVRPARLRPGDLFEILVEGDGLRSAAGHAGGSAIPLFSAGEGRFRGFGGVPLSAAGRAFPVHVAVVDGELAPTTGAMEIALAERAVTSATLAVHTRFTSPSRAEAAQIRADTKALKEAYAAPFGPPEFEATFADPLPNERGSRFGERRMINGRMRSTHRGLDIHGAMNEPVVAANAGTVVLARPCFTSGLTVIVSHGAGLFTGYLHLSRFEVKVGQKVERGQVLGLVGSTGRSTGPHLHFSAKLHDTLIDPEALLAFEFSKEDEAAAR